MVTLAFFNLVFVLGPFAAVSAVLFAFCIVSLVLATSPLWIVMGSGIPDSLPALQLEIFGSLMLGGSAFFSALP
ncbi:DUF1700 domain-containing protein [Paenibacillus sp. CC-CFT747]|nr:DUF1700 domain-containing protein [Paenibacillus sp. CC-CFT747]